MSTNSKPYTDKIRAAKKGKDVRDSIADGIDMVSDENNTYEQIKKDVVNAKNEIDANVKANQKVEQDFAADITVATQVNTDLIANKKAGDTTNTNLVANKKAGDTTNTNLVANKKAGDTTNTNLAKNISDGNTLNDNLAGKLTQGNQLHETLTGDITAAGQAERSLEQDITSAGQAERSLEQDITSAGENKTALDGSIKTAGEQINVMTGLVQSATQVKGDLEKDIETANQTNAQLVETTAESVATLDAKGQEQVQAIIEAGGGIENALSNYFALRRSNKVFTTKLYKYTTSTSPVGEKLNDNADMICTPSTGITPGQDDYQQYGLFQHFTCNWHVDENGFNHVDALEGQVGFTKTGKVQVGEVTMGGWFGIEDVGDAVLYHYSAVKSERTPHPMKESINPDGTVSPIMIHGKYKAIDIEGAPYSSAGGAPANGCQAADAKDPVSYTGMVGYMHKLGAHYCGTTCWDLFYLQLMFIIKYATTNSQSIMAGCTSYNYQYNATVEETGVMRVVMAKANAAKFVVGSYVSIGEVGEATNKDRYYAYMHNLAYSVKVTRVEDVDDTNAAVYVDAPEAFDTTLTTCMSTMPWHTGSTDEVVGSDGSPGSNTSGIFPCKMQGIEWHLGAYDVLGNVFMDIVTGADGNPARDVWVCEDASLLTTNVTTAKSTYKKASAQVPYTAASWKYITEETTDIDRGIMIPTGTEAGSATGWCDGLYTDVGTSGQREWLALGYLSSGARAGRWVLRANYGWSNAYWHIVSGVSPNGTRGEYQATA